MNAEQPSGNSGWFAKKENSRPVEQLINDNTLVALALLVAESLPKQKELMIRLIEHFVLLKNQDHSCLKTNS